MSDTVDDRPAYRLVPLMQHRTLQELVRGRSGEPGGIFHVDSPADLPFRVSDPIQRIPNIPVGWIALADDRYCVMGIVHGSGQFWITEPTVTAAPAPS